MKKFQVHPAEAAYWDEQAQERVVERLHDNLIKRQEIVKRLLDCDQWLTRTVLEIGVGSALAAGAINLLTLCNWRYVGTDVSKKFCDHASKSFGLNVAQTDVRSLPAEDGVVDSIWAFDSLEHVRPKDRAAGYCEMNRVLHPKTGTLYINMPLDEEADCHDNHFNHPFDMDDLKEIESVLHMHIVKYEAYSIYYEAIHKVTRHAWVVMQKNGRQL